MVESLKFTDFFPEVLFDDNFQKFFVRKVRDAQRKLKIKKQVKKIICDPHCGKPLRYGRKNTLEVYIPPYRLYYNFSEKEERIYFLEISHKDKQ